MRRVSKGQLELDVNYLHNELLRSSNADMVNQLDSEQTCRRLKPNRPVAAEFFAGIGLVRAALEQNDIDVVFANDIEPSKYRLYADNFGDHDFVLGDVREIHGRDVPSVDLATASFPCTDLSLAGGRAGLGGENSSMFWEFARVLEEMPERPSVVVLENVPGFATSRQGRDLRNAIERLNGLGYVCDLVAVDAKYFVPQSRQRLFVVGHYGEFESSENLQPSLLRPNWLIDFVERNRDLNTHLHEIPEPPARAFGLKEVVERIRPDDMRWWGVERTERFVDSLSAIQVEKLTAMREGRYRSWATAYRRTRQGAAVWEIRGDGISGCLRTAGGGSSRQAIVEAGRGQVRVRWMTPREYARLQGADNFLIDGVSDNQARSGFGDAVCVPAVGWLVEHHVMPLLEASRESTEIEFVANG